MAHRQVSAFAVALLVVLGVLFMAAPARAEDGAAEREIKAVKRKIQELQHAAEQAQQSGNEDKAHELAKRARDLTQRLEAFFERRAKEGADNANPKKRVKRRPQDQKRKTKMAAKNKRKASPEKTVHSLSVAIDSLKALGGHEELIQHLAQTIEHIKHRARDEHAHRRQQEERREKERHADQRRQKERHAEDEDEERAGLRWRVETMRMALPALREGEKGKLVAILERAIRTGEMLLEGREDEKAREVFAQTPSFPELAEVLMVSAKLWRGFGHREQAQRVHKLSRYYAERSEQREAEEREEEIEEEHEKRRDRGDGERRNRESRERARRDREDVRRHDDRHSDEIQELRAHLQHLRKQVEDLARHLEKVAGRK